MKTYAFLLPYAPDRYQGLPEDEVMAIIGDYVAWVEEMAGKGVYKGGHKLVDAPGRVVSGSVDAVDVHEGPYTELAEVLGGVMIVEAADYDAAVEIARSHPHLTHNERIEIREIEDV